MNTNLGSRIESFLHFFHYLSSFSFWVNLAWVSLGLFVFHFIVKHCAQWIMKGFLYVINKRRKAGYPIAYAEFIQTFFPLKWFMYFLNIYIILNLFPFQKAQFNGLDKFFSHSLLLLLTWGLLKIAIRLCVLIKENMYQGKEKYIELINSFTDVFKLSGQIVVVTTFSLIILNSIGINIRGFLGALGIGGIAVAYAGQDVIKNLFGTITIALDKPFYIGQRVHVKGQVDGIVEAIGLRSTRIRTLTDRSLVIVPNGIVSTKSISNYALRNHWRVRYLLPITYNVCPKNLKAFKKTVEDILEAEPNIVSDSRRIGFYNFGTDGLELLVLYLIDPLPFKDYVVLRNSIALKILEAVAENNLTVALPSRILYPQTENTNPNAPLKEVPAST